MKKTLATVLVLSLIVALSACGELATTSQQPTAPTTAQTKGLPEADQQPTASVTTPPVQPAQEEPKPAQNETQPAQEETKPVQEETKPAAPETTPPTQPEETQPAQTQPAEKKAISRDQAIVIALQAAGLTKDGVTDLEAELDKERNGLFWEVSFETKTTEYDYDIHAYDGTVAKVETEKEDERPAATTPPTKPVEPQPAEKKAISRDQAIVIALQAAGLTKDGVTDLEAELDKERNGLFWEVSFETKQTEYSYEIHAQDGTIAKVEQDRND